jgi:amicyanin
MHRAFKTTALAALLPIAVATAAALPAQAATAPAHAATATAQAQVRIANFTFQQPVLSVKAGTTVTWTNDDDIPHTVVAVDKSFKSKVLDTGDRFSFTFAKPGQFAYFCSLHPHMTGKVIVSA